jgi:hypothetical protein
MTPGRKQVLGEVYQTGITEASEYVFFSEVGEIIKNLLLSHSGGQIGEHVIDGDSHASYARLPAALV